MSNSQCPACGQPFTPGIRGVPQVYCSAKCRDRINGLKKRGLPVTAPPRDVTPRPCDGCGQIYTPRTIGAEQRFCSMACQQHGWYKQTKAPPPPRNCGICGASFVPADGHARYCSTECRGKASVRISVAHGQRHPEWKRGHDVKYREPRREELAAKAREYALRPESKAVRHATRATNPDADRNRSHLRRGKIREGDRISYRAIWERDSGICGLCGKCVTFEVMTLDHIIPFAFGGPHRFSNAWPAHASCNSRKGGRYLSLIPVPTRLAPRTDSPENFRP